MLRRSPWWLFAYVFLGCLGVVPRTWGQADQAELKVKPITTAGGELGQLLRQWWKEGTAAGNVGDYYDNRDGSHSDLNMTPYPQLQKVHYSPEDIKTRRHWAAQRVTLPYVVFGNSSTSAPPQLGGSNIRMYYTSPNGLALLYNHYRKNNIYIYPEHRDHDPGHNGAGDAWGDLYPTNTPYLLASQGSSGSDQPFMRAIPFTLAAFRPEVKKKLIDTGLLMPTLQLILRSTNKHLKAPQEYLTGKAHPTVFEGAWVNDLAMVKLAHALTLETIPPLVQLRVLEEDGATPGIDFFDPAKDEKLTDTPAVIARIWRGKAYQRRLVVSAEGSFDVNKRPLTFHWSVLRGDAGRIKIKPLNQAGSVVELTVPFHARRPIAPGSMLESNRVDIGAFVHNGVYHSAPGFVTFFSLDSEARTYDEQGRPLEIGHGVGSLVLNVKDWPAFLEQALAPGFPGSLCRWTDRERQALAGVLPTIKERQQALEAARKNHQQAEDRRRQAEMAWKKGTERVTEARKTLAGQPSEANKEALSKAEAELQALEMARKKASEFNQTRQKELTQASKALNDCLERPLPDGLASLRALVVGRLSSLIQDHDFSQNKASVILERPKAGKGANPKTVIEKARLPLLRHGLLKEQDGQLQPVRGLTAEGKPRLTGFEKYLLQRYHAELLGLLVFPDLVSCSFPDNFVDFRLAVRKNWRDLYHHDAQGQCLGWTRSAFDGTTHYTAEGHLVLEKDTLGRCLKARGVRYVLEPSKPPIPNQLRAVPTDSFFTYEYANEQDRRGRIKNVPVGEK